jgi:glycosyltransferase involved in cell wall biosynthesis
MRVFNACDESWTVNDACAEVLRGYGIKKEPMTMENGTDMKPVPDSVAAKAAINALCGIDETRKVLLFTGRLVALKNIFFIADALKELKARGQEFTMIFVGDGADKNALQAKFEEEGLSGSVYFAGKVYDRQKLAEFYARADLFVFPSFYDTDGVVKREAASQYTPTIFSDGSIVAKSVTKDHNAFVASHDAAAYAEEIIRAFNDGKTYNNIAENAHKELYIPWEATAKKTFERYKFLIESKKNN